MSRRNCWVGIKSKTSRCVVFGRWLVLIKGEQPGLFQASTVKGSHGYTWATEYNPHIYPKWARIHAGKGNLGLPMQRTWKLHPEMAVLFTQTWAAIGWHERSVDWRNGSLEKFLFFRDILLLLYLFLAWFSQGSRCYCYSFSLWAVISCGYLSERAHKLKAPAPKSNI